ncbi:DUF2490 domain-containing protein [Robertkochia solimangrovi]|uniref:DUF2490 domain-containing protein n=1 Tax=Robertkochia solimangrovi TaxID=2213046 RepID=UPI00118085B9|nr:DUF2490 domain-containing protein [Robertkochia solimangrovi]
MLVSKSHRRLFKRLALVLVFFFFMGFYSIKAQVAVAEKGTFLFTGVSMDIPGNNKFVFYYGYSPSDNFQALVALPFFKLHKNIQFMPGYMMTKTDGNEIFTNLQHHFLPSLIFNFKLSDRFTLTDRNMYFRLERKNTDAVSFYRNRIGLIYHTKLFKRPADIFLHDAMFWSLDSGKFTRNRVILGTTIKAFKWLSPQFWYVLQNDTGLFPRHQFYLILTVPLENFGVFKKKETTNQ